MGLGCEQHQLQLICAIGANVAFVPAVKARADRLDLQQPLFAALLPSPFQAKHGLGLDQPSQLGFQLLALPASLAPHHQRTHRHMAVVVVVMVVVIVGVVWVVVGIVVVVGLITVAVGRIAVAVGLIAVVVGLIPVVRIVGVVESKRPRLFASPGWGAVALGLGRIAVAIVAPPVARLVGGGVLQGGTVVGQGRWVVGGDPPRALGAIDQQLHRRNPVGDRQHRRAGAQMGRQPLPQ